MICQKCGEDELEVTHSYKAKTLRIQRVECSACLAIHTTVTTIVNVNPPRGQGAGALARRHLKEEAK